MITKELTLASWNIRSLGQGVHGARKRCGVRAFLRRATPHTEILLLQEHCYSLEDCLKLTTQLNFNGGDSFWNIALYIAEGNKFHAGTGILVSQNFVSKIVAKGILVDGRAQYIVLETNKQKIGILNVYAPYETKPRARFWEALTEAHLPEADWLVAGDFNITEVAEDRSVGYHNRNVGRRETAAWGRFTLHLGIHDVFYSDEYRRLGSKRHTWRRQKL